MSLSSNEGYMTETPDGFLITTERIALLRETLDRWEVGKVSHWTLGATLRAVLGGQNAFKNQKSIDD